MENKYPAYPSTTLPYPPLQYLAGLSGGPTKQKGKRRRRVGGAVDDDFYSGAHPGSYRHSIEVFRVNWQEHTRGRENARKLPGISLYVCACVCLFQTESNVGFTLVLPRRNSVGREKDYYAVIFPVLLLP